MLSHLPHQMGSVPWLAPTFLRDGACGGSDLQGLALAVQRLSHAFQLVLDGGPDDVIHRALGVQEVDVDRGCLPDSVRSICGVESGARLG